MADGLAATLPIGPLENPVMGLEPAESQTFAVEAPRQSVSMLTQSEMRSALRAS